MTEFVRPPRADGDAPLVDTETGETPPLSPQRRGFTIVEYDLREWHQYERALVVHMESDDAP